MSWPAEKAGPFARPPAGAAGTPPPAAPSATKVAEAQAPAPGIDLSIIDRSVNPCDDFYRFSCGKWLERTPIPPDRPLWGRSFSEVFERNQARLREIVEGDARGEADPADPYARKVGDFYSTCMDEHKADTASLATLPQGLAPIHP